MYRQVLAATVLSTMLFGCATITKGVNQTVSVDTPGVPGAACTLKSEGIGTVKLVTPKVINLPKSQHSVEVKCTKPCYTDGVGVIASNTEGMAAGNVIVGGVIGLGVDAATGAMNKYSPSVQIAMQPLPGCRP